MSETTASFDQARNPQVHSNPYAAPFTFLEDASVDTWVGRTYVDFGISMGIAGTPEEQEAASFKQVRTNLIQRFAVTCEGEASSLTGPTSENFAAIYKAYQGFIAAYRESGEEGTKAILNNPKFIVPDIKDLAEALDGVWLHSAKLSQYAATIQPVAAAPAPASAGQAPA